MRFVVITLCVLAGCGPTFDHGFEVIGTPVPAAYEREILVAAEVIRVQEGVLHREWGGTVNVHAEPFPCPDGEGFCSGWSGDPHAIRVVYAEALGLGPAVGKTAVEWELCNAARQMRTCGDGWSLTKGSCGGNDGSETVRCITEAMPKIVAALGAL